MMKPARAPIFIFDYEAGFGLGHRQRTSRVASYLKSRGESILLFAPNIFNNIDLNSDEIQILPPAYDGAFAGRVINQNNIEERKRIYRRQFDTHQPEIIITFYNITGVDGELYPILKGYNSGLHLHILRPVIGSDRIVTDFLLAKGGKEIIQKSNTLLGVCGDERTQTAIEEIRRNGCSVKNAVAIGYLVPKIFQGNSVIESSHPPNIIASAGSGHDGAKFVSAIVDVAGKLPEADFQLVLGPLSTQLPGDIRPLRGNLQIVKSSDSLLEAHANADLIISHGGYNSIVEGFAGRTPIVVIAGSPDSNASSERTTHVQLLKSFYPIFPVTDLQNATDTVSQALERLPDYKLRSSLHDLNFRGFGNVYDIVFSL